MLETYKTQIDRRQAVDKARLAKVQALALEMARRGIWEGLEAAGGASEYYREEIEAAMEVARGIAPADLDLAPIVRDLDAFAERGW